eukprot:5084638-Pleurochrysis_carterae.AAC.1
MWRARSDHASRSRGTMHGCRARSCQRYVLSVPSSWCLRAAPDAKTPPLAAARSSRRRRPETRARATAGACTSHPACATACAHGQS